MNKYILNLSIPILFVGFVLYTIPIQQVFSFDPDEGLQLMKALLYSQGFSLYTEIWSDQPPVFTILLSIWFSLFGRSVFASRILVLFFSTVLVYCFYQLLRYFIGIFPAIAGTLLLVFSSNFIQLSVSVMVGIPCLSMSLLSIYTLLIYHKKQEKKFLIISGILWALSLQIKLISVVLIPPIVVLISYLKLKNNPVKLSYNKLLFDVIFWLVTIGLSFLISSILLNSLNYEQLWQAHNIGNTNSYSKDYNINLVMNQVIGNRRVFSLLAFLGILAIFSQRRWEGIIPLAWLGSTLVFMLNHRPIWYHHYLLIFMPMAWLSAYTILVVVNLCQQKNGYFYLRLRQIKKLIIPSLTVILLIKFMANSTNELANLKPVEKNLRVKAVELLIENKKSTQWVFTDSPIIAFYADLPVPPQVAVLSSKRFSSNHITLDDIQSVLQNYRPEQIVLARWKYKFTSHQGIKNYLDKNYRKIYPSKNTDKEVPFEQYVLNR
ncbi:MAG: glycosyltransferase family 39 protein [Coleofasciculus sp. B1-GNL1-01]|uniref:ArnT family glycosyltransferase n=1 Tax=Coleofasciculus sp. B1-GNL1-01 TaxID=3068484 RepID=UPI0032FF4A2A